ncbi:ABC transporter substrate-binding protein [Acrocarpospora catenulata]|uniref:ABC transporter substrate-binding protein n=1 Tax=Acrocarpospora catenulata TaxID=2836182 RepID=UPI001BDAD3F2|nr:ABC transporter substrate-binding protein [Acrocarpospora catenulata]
MTDLRCSRGLDRRRFLQLSGLAVGGSIVLAACGEGGSPEGAAPAGTTSELGKFLTIDQHAGKGATLDLGVVLPSSGSGSAYASEMKNGVELAVAHLAGAGALQWKPQYKDNKSGDPQAGIDATKDLGLSGTPAMLCSYIANLGSQVPGIEQYQMLTLDGAGGTGTFAQGKPYFYGARIIIPDDIYPGTFQWFKQAHPEITKVGHLTWDLGPSTTDLLESSRKAITAAGFSPAAHVSSAPANTDYSAQIREIESSGANAVVISVLDDVSIAAFLKQYSVTGRKDVVFVSTTNFTPKTYQTVAGSDALANYHFCYDYFDGTTATSDFGRYFTESYKQKHQSDPTSLSANFYEDTLVLWECVRRVNAKGGDPAKGSELLAAFESDPVFPSVYGGSGAEPGVISFDTTTHSVSKRPSGIYTQKNGTVVAVATFDVSGSDFKLLG